MHFIKTIISLTAVLLTLIAYIPYIRDILKGKTTPHIFTWLIWAIITAIAFIYQIQEGAGIGSLATLAITVICVLIFMLSIKRGEKNITKSDTFFLLLSFAAIYLWLVAKEPLVTVLLISSINGLALVPTLRKSWNKPYSETLITYEITAIRYGLSILALENYNFLTWFFPASSVVVIIIFCSLIIFRRKQFGIRKYS